MGQMLTVHSHGLEIFPALDAHIASFMENIRTGEYFPPFPTAAGSTVTPGTNALYAMPFIVARDMTIDRLAIDITTASDSQTARLGIYNNGTNCYPGTLLLDGGTVSLTSTGTVAVTISQALSKGLYWVAYGADSNPTLNGFLLAYPIIGYVSNDFANTSPNSHWRKTSWTFAAFPDPYPSGGVGNNSYAPAVFPRLLTLD
uniref:Uncharacterized protein n=1 Tax=viral metagenome TaxID=1070528 RepID=A0A6M3LUE7_9ZZZZ